MSQDSYAFESSEIFRLFAAAENKREAEERRAAELTKISEERAFEMFLNFQDRIQNNGDLKRKFQYLQEKLANEPSFRLKLGKALAEGILLLNLEV